VKIVERQRFSRSDPFEREFRGVEHFAPLSRSHPGLVHILHVGRNELRGSFYYIMELADDQESGLVVDPTRYSPRTLASDIARRGRLPAAACVDLGIALAGALEHLHQQGLVHRDLKPANIVFVGGRPKLADAGLVTRVTPAGTTASRVGTAGYLAPEGPGTARADVYSLGKVLYEVATGCSHERFPELPSDLGSTSDADLLLRLHQLILTACETDPGDRFPSASALEVELRRLLSPPAPSSPPMP
jgi:serine/threonine protein kinase